MKIMKKAIGGSVGAGPARKTPGIGSAMQNLKKVTPTPLPARPGAGGRGIPVKPLPVMGAKPAVMPTRAAGGPGIPVKPVTPLGTKTMPARPGAGGRGIPVQPMNRTGRTAPKGPLGKKVR